MRKGVSIKLSGEVESKFATNPENYAVKIWGLKRSEKYGSKHIDERTLKVTSAKLSSDNKTVELHIEGIEPTWGMEIKYSLLAADGKKFSSVIHNSIFRLAD
jgi:hypothetical protein